MTASPLLRETLYELLLIWRMARAWPWVVLTAWAWICAAQEPAFARSPQIRLFWSGVESALWLVLAALPLAWVLMRGEPRGGWNRRTCRSPARTITAGWLALAAYGSGLAAATALSSYTVYRFYAPARAPDALRLVHLTLPAYAPLAAWAQVLPFTGLGAVASCVAWVVLLAGSLAVFGPAVPIPLDSLWATGDGTTAVTWTAVSGGRHVLAALLAVLGAGFAARLAADLPIRS